MKLKYKLKNWVVVGIYLVAVVGIISSLFLVNKLLNAKLYSNDTLSYVYKGLFDEIYPVVNYTNNEVIKPFSSETVEILKDFYDKDDDTSVQENSLIMYQNTYMPNTGILYKSSEEFDVMAVLDGTVADITADEIMGNIIVIKHSNNLSTVYQCVNEVNVLIGDLVKQGDVIGTSGSNKIDSSSENTLLFEVINNGEYVNPEKFYEMSVDELL
jgi:stage II sporulation protein Q